MEPVKAKTWKREVAAALLAFLLFLAVFDLLAGGNTRALAWAELFALPFIGFAAAAFGMDAAMKQGGWRKPDALRPASGPALDGARTVLLSGDQIPGDGPPEGFAG